MTHLLAAQFDDLQGRKPCVLIVDDEALNRAILAKVLKSRGFDTLQASGGKEAIAIVHSDACVDLVLLDLVMPVVDGFEVLSELRKTFNQAELPIILVTASTESDKIVQAFKLGANDYIAKPVDPDVTIARIRTHVSLKESQTALKASEERYSLVSRATKDGLWDWDLSNNRAFYSDRWTSMLGLEPGSVPSLPATLLNRIHPEDTARVTADLEAHLESQAEQFETEVRMIHEDGSFRWMLCRGIAVRDDTGKAIRLVGSLTDITEGRVADALTGLPNRVLFNERLQKCIQHKLDDSRNNFTLMYLDLDNFKHVNDSLGHECGDQLLVAVSRRLEGSVRRRSDKNDSFVSRLGGDEFAILLEGVGRKADAEKIAERILSSVAAPFTLGGGREFFASVSLGISLSTGMIDDGQEMLHQADTAMYAAKAEGKSCFRVFDPAMKDKVTRRLQLENALRQAIVYNEFDLCYQPIVSLESGKLTGFESLMRWESPELGSVSPAEFIPIAEDIGLIAIIGRWVLEKACHTMAKWKQTDSRFKNLKLGVNISSKQLMEEDFVSHVQTILDSSGLRAPDLCLEITESAILQSPDEASKLLEGIRSLEVTIAVDDFGTGFSSLAYLHRLPLDILKVDRSFVDQMILSSDNHTIVSTIVTLANHLNLDIVAEGVETEEQRTSLLSMGCRLGQGFYFSRPLSADQVPTTNWDEMEFMQSPAVAIAE